MADAREEKLKNARLKLEQFRNKKKSKPGGLTSTGKVSSEGAENTQLTREEQAPQTERNKVDPALGSCSNYVNQPEESPKNEQEQVFPMLSIAVTNRVSQPEESSTIEEPEQDDPILSKAATNIINPPEESNMDEQDKADATLGSDAIYNVIQSEDSRVDEEEQVDPTLSIAVTNITNQPEESTNEEEDQEVNLTNRVSQPEESSTIEEQEQDDPILSKAGTNIINPPEESNMDEQDQADAILGSDTIDNVIQPEDSIVDEEEQVDPTLSIAVTNITNQPEESTIEEQDQVDPTLSDAVTNFSNHIEGNTKDGQAQGDDNLSNFCPNYSNKIEKFEQESFQNNGNQVEMPLENKQTQIDETMITLRSDNANEVEKYEKEPMQADANLITSCSNNGSQVDKLEVEEMKMEDNLNIHYSNHGNHIFKPENDQVQEVIANEGDMNSGSMSLPISVNQEEINPIINSIQSDDHYIPNKGDYVEGFSQEANVCSESDGNISEDLREFSDESSKKEIVSGKNKEEISFAFHEENQAAHSTENLNISNLGDWTVKNDIKIHNISEPSKEKPAEYSTECVNDLLDDALEKEYVFVENSGGINIVFDPEGKNIQSARKDSECDGAFWQTSSSEAQLVDKLDEAMDKSELETSDEEKVLVRSSNSLNNISIEVSTVSESELVLNDVPIEENTPIESKNIISNISSELITLDMQTTQKSQNDYIDVPKDDTKNNSVQKIKNAIIDSAESLENKEVNAIQEKNENVTKEEVLSQSKIATENEENASKFIEDVNAYDIKALILKKDISQCNSTQENYHLEINQLEERNRQLSELLEQEKINKEELATEVVNKTNQLDNLKEAMLAKMKEVYQTHFKEKSELERSITDTEKKFSDQLDSLSSQVISLSTEKIEIEKNSLISKNQLTAQFEENSFKVNDKLKQKDEECHQLYLKVESIQNEHLQVKKELSALNSQYISLLQESGTQQLLNEKDVVISSLRKELLLAKKVFNELSEEKTNLINERNQLANQYSSYSKDLASHTEKLSEHLRRFQGENARLVQRERALLDHLAVLEAKLLAPNGQDGNVKGEYFLLKEKYVILEGQMKGTAEENGALKKKISEHLAEARKAKISNDGELQSLNHKLENKERRVLELEAHIKQVEISNCLNIEKLQKSLEVKNMQIVNLESQLKRQMDGEDGKEFQSKRTIKEIKLDDSSKFRNAEKKEFVSNSSTIQDFGDQLSQKDIDSNGQFEVIQRKPIEEGDILSEVKHNDEFEFGGNSVDDQKEFLDEIKDPDKDDEICNEVENELKLAMERVGQLTTEKAHLEELVSDLQEETEIIGDYITIYQNQRKQQKGKLEEKDKQLQRMEKEKQRLTGSLLHMQHLMKEAGMWKRLEAGIDLTDQGVTNNEDDSGHRKEHEFEPWLWQPSAGKVLTV